MASHNEFKFERTIRGIAERIAYQLADTEYEGYDQKWIIARISDTFKWLQGKRPNLFATSETFELSPGKEQCVPEECDKLLEVLSVTVDGKECPVFESKYSELKLADIYDKLLGACNQGIAYQFGISEVDPRKFRISPPISPVKPVTVTASCSNSSRFFDDLDKEIDCDVAKWINTVIEYVLYQAQTMDGENPTTQSVADRHRSTFFDLAPVQRREEAQ